MNEQKVIIIYGHHVLVKISSEKYIILKIGTYASILLIDKGIVTKTDLIAINQVDYLEVSILNIFLGNTYFIMIVCILETY